QDFETLRQALIEFSPHNEYTIIYNREPLEQKRFKQFSYLYQPSQFSPDWVEEDSYRLLTNSSPALSGNLKQITMFANNDDDFHQKLAKGESFSKHYSLDNQHFILTLTTVKDINQANIAYLVSVSESPSISTQQSHFYQYAWTMSIILLIVGYGLWRMVRSGREYRKQHDYLENIHDTMSEGLYVTDAKGMITIANSAAERILGYQEHFLVGQNAHDLFHNPEPLEPNEYRACPIEEAAKLGHGFSGEIRFLKSDHSNIWVEASSQPMITGGELQGAVTVFSDITEQKAKEDSLRISATAFETQDGIMITNPNGIILRVNQAFTRITGYTAEEVIGQTPKILSSGRQRPSFYEDMWQHLKSKHFWQGEIWNRRKDNEVFLEWLTITAVLNNPGKITHYVANFSDITERHQAQDRIQKLAFYDSLTQLPNRRLLLDRLEQAVRYTKRTNQCGALFFIDLDNFKTLNDSKGHMIGDMLLEEVATRLQHSVREVDTIARLGGDEFVILLENLGECKIDAVQHSEKLALSILDSFNTPFELNGHNHHSSPSIGIEIVHPTNEGPDEILAHADLAMYQAKKHGRNTMRFFNPDMQITIERLAELQSELHQALKNNALELYYQPQVNQYAHVIAAEALVRWNHPEKGFISPAVFIPMAENSGLIIPLGDYVLQTACNTLFNWAQHPSTEDIKLSVNVSAKQFADIDFVQKVKKTISDTGVNPNNLKLELTESVMVKDVDRTIQTMNDLRDIGIRFSMDDFGTGHSSLSYLKRLPLAQLKIDQSFIRDLTTDSDDAAIVKTIIAMSNTLKLEVVAEGVETVEQKEFLKNNKCFIYQGYLFSRPLPLSQFEDLVSTTQEINDFDFDLDSEIEFKP
ncbi:MAG: EAL domain-containing protein, partial [Pseudomonadota bacterium]|nr:EAL domain-containing protein [Pseudomonadota bacterium]